MATLVGAPDGQRPVVATQTVLASLTSADTSQSVDLPANCESLTVIMPTASFAGSVSIVGNTTGVNYPVGSVSTLTSSDFYEVSPVFPIVDGSVTVTLSEATTTDWWIISDSAPRYQFGTTSGGSPLDKYLNMLGSDTLQASASGGTLGVTARNAGDQILVVVMAESTTASPVPSCSASGMTFTAIADHAVTFRYYNTLYLFKGTGAKKGLNTITVAVTSGTVSAFGVAVANLSTSWSFTAGSGGTTPPGAGNATTEDVSPNYLGFGGLMVNDATVGGAYMCVTSAPNQGGLVIGARSGNQNTVSVPATGQGTSGHLQGAVGVFGFFLNTGILAQTVAWGYAAAASVAAGVVQGSTGAIFLSGEIETTS